MVHSRNILGNSRICVEIQNTININGTINTPSLTLKPFTILYSIYNVNGVNGSIDRKEDSKVKNKLEVVLKVLQNVKTRKAYIWKNH